MQNREQMKRDQESHENSVDWMCGCQPAEVNSFGKAPPGQELHPRRKSQSTSLSSKALILNSTIGSVGICSAKFMTKI